QSASGNIRGYHYFLSWLFPLLGFFVSILGGENILSLSSLTQNAFLFTHIAQGILVSIALYKAYKPAIKNDQTGISAPSETLHLHRLKQTREEGEHSRLLRVIEKERELLAELKQKESIR